MTIKTYSKKATGNIKLSDHFKLYEFASKDGSDTVLIDDKLVQLLEFVRNYFGKPVIITSAYRSPAHNKKVGGSPNSQHLKGTAADIIVQGVDPMRVAEVAEYYLGSSSGIGWYPKSGFTHIDMRSGYSRWYEFQKGKITSHSSFNVASVVKEMSKRKEAEQMPKIEKIPIIIDGQKVLIDGILINGHNFVAIRPTLEAVGCKVSAQGSTPIITTK